MPVCFILNIRTGILNTSGGSVRFDEYPYQYSGHLRKSGAFVLVKIRISIPDASGRAGAFISVNIRINIPNASGGAMAGAFILVNIRTGILNAPGGFRA